jgi:hypothetical protein
MPFKKQRANKEQQIKPSSSGREWGKAAVDAVITALSSAKESSDWNPIVKSALSGANEIVNLCRVRASSFYCQYFDLWAHDQQFQNNKKDWKDLADHLQHSVPLINSLPSQDQTPSNLLIENMKHLLG